MDAYFFFVICTKLGNQMFRDGGGYYRPHPYNRLFWKSPKMGLFITTPIYSGAKNQLLNKGGDFKSPHLRDNNSSNIYMITMIPIRKSFDIDLPLKDGGGFNGPHLYNNYKSIN